MPTFREFLRNRLLYEGGFQPIAARVLWTMFPSVVSCALFWYIALVRPIVSTARSTPAHSHQTIQSPLIVAVVGVCGIFTALAGAAMNAIVTLANGGYMPVAKPEVHSALWVTSTAAHHLRFLGDNYGGFSLGDFVIAAGVVAFSLAKLCDRCSQTTSVVVKVERQVSTLDRGMRVFCGAGAFFLSPGFIEAPVLVGATMSVILATYILTLRSEWLQWRQREFDAALNRYNTERTHDSYITLMQFYKKSA